MLEIRPKNADPQSFIINYEEQKNWRMAVEISHFTPRGFEFAVLNCIAMFHFKTQTSIGFHLGHYTNGRKPASTLDEAHKGGSFEVTGSLVVHHPCHGHIKALLFTEVASEVWHDWTLQKEFVREVFQALEIPNDETYHAHFVTVAKHTSLLQDTDRDGVCDSFHV